MPQIKHPFCVSLAAAMALGLAVSSAAASTGISVHGGKQTTVSYRCKGGKTMRVTYVNSPPDSLAIVPVDGHEQIFANVLAGSGTRYASGVYVWWTKGSQASLYDLRHGEDSPPVADCEEKH